MMQSHKTVHLEVNKTEGLFNGDQAGGKGLHHQEAVLLECF